MLGDLRINSFSNFIACFVCGAFCLTLTLRSNAQQQEEPPNTTGDLEKLIDQGNRSLGKGHFGAARPIWQEVVKQDPDNADAQFKLGMCYRNSLDEQDKALPHFKKAVTNLTDKYNFGSSSGRAAPYDALYFLGETYLFISEPDSALNQFTAYQDMYDEGDPPIDVDRAILMCINAKKATRNMRDVTLIHMDQSLNSSYAETNPVVTIDNSIMFFSSRRPVSGDESQEPDEISGKLTENIYISNRDESGSWQNAALFNLSTEANEAPLSLSADGLTLLIRREVKGKIDLYESNFDAGVWSKPKPLGSNINSSFNEPGASLSGDGQHLYFVSDREGGQGGYDIYHCQRKSNEKWGKAENISRTINSSYNEISPFIHPDGKTLFYSSNGYRNKGMGGYDIYYTELRDDGTWSEPQNMGYPINTTRDDLYYYITEGGIRYYASIHNDKSYDLFMITGGGFEVENLEVGTEVVTLTTEMNVTEVMEVEKEVQTEVEVLDLSVLDEMELPDEGEPEVEEIDLTELEPEVDSAAIADSLAQLEEEMKEEEVAEEESETIDLDVEAIIMERLDSLDRIALIQKVQAYLEGNAEQKETAEEITVYFAFNSRKVTNSSQKELNKILRYLQQHPNSKVEVIGHTDEQGNWTTNFKISKERAEAVYKYFLTQGVSRDKLLYYGKGSTEPVASNQLEEGRKLNRRVVVKVLEE